MVLVVTYARVPPPGPEPTMTYSYDSSWGSCVGLPAARPASNRAERNFILLDVKQTVGLKRETHYGGEDTRYQCLWAYWNLIYCVVSTLALRYQQPTQP